MASEGELYPSNGFGKKHSLAKVKVGDVVGHLVDVKSKSLTIFVNGKNEGVIYGDLEFPLWPAVSIWGRAIITADFGAKLPTL